MPLRKVGPNQYEAGPQVVNFETGKGATVPRGFKPRSEKMQKMFDEIISKIRELRRSNYEPNSNEVEIATDHTKLGPKERNLDFPHSLVFERGSTYIQPVAESQKKTES